ncbi:uncharacterized protein A4U43_C08F31440 [Asparagus officinalis]|nr:uncharacterized protein A4U43_C08F31440 [Asparagus officinalis]
MNDDICWSAFSKLLKQSSLALLNAYTRPGFPYGAWEVKSLLLEALISDDVMGNWVAGESADWASSFPHTVASRPPSDGSLDVRYLRSITPELFAIGLYCEL